MVRVEVLAYTPTDFLEEKDVTIGRCRDLAEKYAVTWVDVVDPNERTLEELGRWFGCHPLALEDAQNRKLSPKVDEYVDMVFVVARAIVWAEAIDTDQLSLFVAKKFVITIHGPAFPSLEDVRIRLRKRNPKMLKSGADYRAYTILDTLDANREIIASLMETQATLVSNQMSEVIKVLTVIFTITLPIAVVSSLFGMNVSFYGFNEPVGLYIAVTLMALPTFALTLWMRRKGWF